MEKIGGILFGKIAGIIVIPKTIRMNDEDLRFTSYFRTVSNPKGGCANILIKKKRDIEEYRIISQNKHGKINILELTQILKETESGDYRFKSAWKHLEFLWEEMYIKFPLKFETKMKDLHLEYWKFHKSQLSTYKTMLAAVNTTQELRTEIKREISRMCSELMEFYNENLYEWICKNHSHLLLLEGGLGWHFECEKLDNLIIEDFNLECDYINFSNLKITDGRKRTASAFPLEDYLELVVNNIIHVQENNLSIMPVTFTNDVKEPHFHYFDLSMKDKITNIPLTAWNEYALHYSVEEWEVFKAYTYAIFKAENRSKQALYLLDNGNSGKSQYMNCLFDALGPSLATNIQKDSFSNQFGFAKIWDKRLVCKPDNKDAHILHSEKIHMVLGGDGGDVEYKGQNSFHAKFHCKIIIGSNDRPIVNAGHEHEQCRIILIQPKLPQNIIDKLSQKDENGVILKNIHGHPSLKLDPEFSKNLSKEFWSFLKICEISYNNLCPDHGNIKIPIETQNDLFEFSDINDDIHEEIYDLLDKDPTFKINSQEIKYIWECFSKDSFQNFAKWLHKDKQIIKKRIQNTKENKTYYIGIKFNKGKLKNFSLENGIKLPFHYFNPVADGQELNPQSEWKF